MIEFHRPPRYCLGLSEEKVLARGWGEMERDFKMARRVAAKAVILPHERSIISTSFGDYNLLLYGEKKVGKTSMLSCGGEVCFLEFDPVQSALAIFQVPIRSWNHLQKAIDELSSGGSRRFDAVVIDGVEVMYQLCFDFVCTGAGVKHPSEISDYGATWRAIRDEFEAAIRALLDLPCPIRFTCHSKWIEKKNSLGQMKSKLVPYLTTAPEEVLVGLIDIWATFTYWEKERCIVVVGNEFVGAGHRVDQQFLTSDGRRVREIHAGNSPEEAWANFQTAFNNEQAYADLAEWKEEFSPKKKKVPVKPKLKRIRKK